MAKQKWEEFPSPRKKNIFQGSDYPLTVKPGNLLSLDADEVAFLVMLIDSDLYNGETWYRAGSPLCTK